MTRTVAATHGLAAASTMCLIAAAALTFLAPSRSTFAFVVIGAVVVLLPTGLSVLIAHRPDGARVAVLLGLVGTMAAHVSAKENFRSWLALDHDRAESFVWLEAAWDQSAVLGLMAVGLLLLYFPNGKLPSVRWKWVGAGLVAAAFLEVLYAALAGGQFREPLEFLQRNEPPAFLQGVAGGAVPSFMIAVVLLTLACALSLVARYRRSDQLARLRIKWLALGGFGVALYPVVCVVEIAFWGDPQIGSIVVLVAGLIGIPVGVGIAMLRHDLYGVDRAIITVLAWTGATVTLLAFYAFVTGILGSVAGGESVPVAVGATVIAALALAPLRRLLQLALDRRIYPQQRAATAAIEQLHRDVAEGRAHPEQLEERLRTALRDPDLRLVLGSEPSAGVPVEVAGSVVAHLIPGGSGSSYGVLRSVASKATTMVEVLRVRKDLGQALREVEASRARLVQIGFEERKRLERDLHDGAQQRLVTLGMTMRLAQRHLDDGTIDTKELLDQSVAEIGTAVAELRQIAHGLRPSALDDGLPAAISRLVRSLPMPIDLDIDEVCLPDEVATTAYFVIAEAVTNAIKHAGASRIVLRVTRDAGSVLVHVADDGRGGAVMVPSSGMADRVAAIGGQLTVDSPRGRGTTVEVTLPCAS